ncbi:LCP family protein [Nocardioides sp. JQ2195]|uniref:LCP family protein n=1 Tax=Nocardioides sp. JQ2195 TaxID=2592334 RepID=UPI00143EB5AB|nr:LCP family protein [Nocardioides sp. JQ2195]QIX25588.1 LCP family protein [Nocardioides sp. JQ2195]
MIDEKTGSTEELEPRMVADQPTGRIRVRRKRRRSWFRRHRSLTILMLVALVLLAIVIGWLLWLENQIDDVRRFDTDLGDHRPAQGQGIDILLMGVDDLDGSRDVGDSVYDMLESGRWQPGVARSDTLMLLHIESDHRAAQLVSIPRDSWVDIPGHGRSKINAAFSWGGPSLAARTVEQNLDLRIDHMMIIDFDGFKDVTEAIGGVKVFVPDTVTDPRSGATDWERGFHHLEGDRALHYVRTRYSLPGGDFDRINRQQNFLRTVLDKLTSRGVLLNPVRVSRLADTLGELVMVDAGLTNGKLRDLAIDSRHLRSGAMRFLTAPNSGSGMVGRASVVHLDVRRTRRMFDAMEQGQFESWYAQHEVSELPGTTQVN